MTRRAQDIAPDARRLLEVAARYAAHGWPVLPLHTPRPGESCTCSRASDCGSPGKHPRSRRGLHDASTDDRQVRAWWDRWPHANIGITTGRSSSLLVLDVDLPDGPDSLEQLEATHGRLPATCEQRTGSGGRQLLFAYPAAPEIGNRAALLPGIDVRGDGGYIVVPPSRHSSGDRYRWTGRTPPAPAPDWLIHLLDRERTIAPEPQPPPRIPIPTDGTVSRYATAALERELAALAGAVEGTRNDTLNRAAFNLGQLVGAGALPAAEVTAQLEHVANEIGLAPVEARRTIASGLSAGVARPRPVRAAVEGRRTSGQASQTAAPRALVRRR